jgi:hypothetical protein
MRAGMDCSHRALLRINQQDWNAIGGLHGQQQTRFIGD